jgi:hypothetical protein
MVLPATYVGEHLALGYASTVQMRVLDVVAGGARDEGPVGGRGLVPRKSEQPLRGEPVDVGASQAVEHE